jgi:hypothetical protein
MRPTVYSTMLSRNRTRPTRVLRLRQFVIIWLSLISFYSWYFSVNSFNKILNNRHQLTEVAVTKVSTYLECKNERPNPTYLMFE